MGRHNINIKIKRFSINPPFPTPGEIPTSSLGISPPPPYLPPPPGRSPHSPSTVWICGKTDTFSQGQI